MKTWTEEMIVALIERADNKVLFKMLHSLYERQTSHEQSAEYTRDRNDVGFNAYDAKFLTSVAKGGEKYNQVSNGQAPFVRKALKRYRKQLTDIANRNERQRGNYTSLSNDFAKADDDARDKQPWAGQFVARMDREIDQVAKVVDTVLDNHSKQSATATQVEIDKQEREMNEIVAKAEREQEEAAYRSKMLRDQALQGNLYGKTWDEVFKKEEK